ncbi:OmpH family outer membrane protein [Roseivirga misakiensis]|uniref:Outer membrane chaperone Skp n=1 Tax=Roseivirga misakiensis TaxID=1563681 RepID=A0A1E5T643_9BACT|nr:OmpH family outer membrane protein [Roseivirga misakiensis]OEK06818.1 hypothetical protein BFP71_03935 [Roseivirga misakiensis]
MYKIFSTLVILALIFIFAPAQSALAQKFGHYDSEYVLNKMPEYAEKLKELEALSASYDKEVRSLYNEAERMRAELRATEVLLTSEMKKDRAKAIQEKQEEAAKRSTDLFGYNGLYFKKVDELLLPLRTKVSQTVEVVCKKYGLDYLFDKSADIGIAYSNPVHDYTEFVLEELGIIEQN